MSKCLVAGYIGLMGVGDKEPSVEAGYARVGIGQVDLLEAPRLLNGRQIVFNEVTAPGCGLVYEIGLYNAPEGGELLYYWNLPEPVDVHAGTIPVVHNGKLLLGLDVSANISLASVSAANI